MTNKGKRLLSDLKFYDSYSVYREELGRKETWEESVDSVMDMHYNKFAGNKELKPFLQKATEAYKEKRILASQRSLQYREDQVLKHNHRLFNCSSTFIDRPEVFKEVMFVLLGGCGVGYSVEQRFVNKLPLLSERKEVVVNHVVSDDIQGWSIALNALMMSFFTGSEIVRFDGSQIRPEGAFISGGFKAPGYEPLRKSLEMIENLLEQKVQNKDFQLTSLDCHEIICISSDAVLAAGVRRSALIALFDKNDDLMLNCKTGDWFYKKPWLGRANNTVKLIKGSFTEEEFNFYKESIKEFGEPGLALVGDEDFCTNPCFTADTNLLTPTGYVKIGANVGELELINKDGEIVNGSIWSNGFKDVIELTTSQKTKIKCTPDHRFMLTDGEECQAQDLGGKRIMPFFNINKEVSEYTKYGFIQGDGCLGRLSSTAHKGLEINIGEDDDDIFELFNIAKEEGKRLYYTNGYNEILKVLKFDSSALPERVMPASHLFWDAKDKLMFLKGMYSANGCIIKGQRISYKTTSKKLAFEIQESLLTFGISAYITTNKEKEVLFSNGNYTCKESYDINISKYNSVLIFAEKIGFVHDYKNEALKNLILLKAPKVISIKEAGNEEVFDFNLQDDTHWGVVEGLIAHNCFEIGFIPINPSTKKSCWSFCNLNEVNGAMCKTVKEFYAACEAAAILGTLQASYTNIPFLGEDTKELMEWEALLGVSITGIFDNPKVLLSPEVLQQGAKIVKETNKKVAQIIGINQSARTTCIKPSGNASVLLGTSSGIHPAHSKTYFRIMQMNKGTEMAKVLADNNPSVLEESVWSSSNSDYAVYIPIEENGDGQIFKDSISDLEFMNAVEIVYKNWVLEGTNKDLGYSSRITHNVSNTISVSDWDRVFEHIYYNQDSFCGLSFMAELGDKVYKQAPFTKIMSFEELTSNYGEAAIFASGLIVDALHHFNNDLWDACEAIKNKDYNLVGDRHSVLLKKDIIRRIKKFSKNYLKGNVEKTIDCLKNIYIYHKYQVVKREFKDIDFEKIELKPTFTDVNTTGGMSCSGGACELVRI